MMNSAPDGALPNSAAIRLVSYNHHYELRILCVNAETLVRAGATRDKSRDLLDPSQS
jgi:hypothetical protein